jgi:GNAT superfamily N-acetyltransferase
MFILLLKNRGNSMIKIKENKLTASEFNYLFSSFGWIAPDEEQTSKALENTLCTFSVYDNKMLIGMGRLLGDYAMSFYIKDVAILPDYQGKGIGKALTKYMIAYVKKQLPPGWRVSLELISSKGKEGFYRKFGFEERPCDFDGAGMFMMVEPDSTK